MTWSLMCSNCTSPWSNNTWVGNAVSDVGNGGSVKHAAAQDMVNGGMFNGGSHSFFSCWSVLGVSVPPRNPACTGGAAWVELQQSNMTLVLSGEQFMENRFLFCCCWFLCILRLFIFFFSRT